MAKLAVAMSGGVDSTVAAWLLKQAGHQVLGLTLDLGRGRAETLLDAAAGAAQLEMEHRVVEAGGAFERLVLRPSVEAYARGRTPNPCALCNPEVKFRLLWQAAQEAGCAFLATGHYVRLVSRGGSLFLGQAADGRKSQAYFLARLPRTMLRRLVFPLAAWQKRQVKELAARHSLAAAHRPESQDDCFLPPGGWDELMARYGAVRCGKIKDLEGNILGEHRGLHKFTIGKRRGLGITLGYPAYVVGLEAESASVLVGGREGLACTGLTAAEPLYYQQPLPAEGLWVKPRYNHPGVGCKVEKTGTGLLVRFEQEQTAVAPGQLAVIYHRDRVAASAWITGTIAKRRERP